MVLTLSAGFGSGTGKLTTAITPDSAAVIRLVVDSSQNVIVAASCGTGTSLKAFRCGSAGTGSAFTVGGIVAANFVATTPVTVGGSAGITLRALLEDEAGKTILIGSNTAGGHGQMVAARLGTKWTV